MTEHKIIQTEPINYSSPSGDNRRILMKDSTGDNKKTGLYYGAQVPCLDEMARILVGAQNVTDTATFTGNATWTVSSPNWTNQWDYVGAGSNVWGGFPIAYNAFYEVFVEGWVYCPSAITFAWFGLRIDYGTTIATDTTGGAAYSNSGTSNHWSIRYHNILYLTPSLYTGGYCNVYPHFYATTSPANQVLSIGGGRCHLKMLSQASQY